MQLNLWLFRGCLLLIYFTDCRKHAEEPEAPFSGRIIYRTTPKKHAELSQYAVASGEGSINAFIEQAVSYYTQHVMGTRV